MVARREVQHGLPRTEGRHVSRPTAAWNGSLLAFALGLALILGGCGDAGPRLQNGDPAPAFELPQLDGGPLAFPADLRGKVVALRFWADWCPSCEEEMRDLDPVYRKYRDRGLVVLAVNVLQDRATAAAFIHRLDIPYRVLIDEDGAVARGFGVTGLPTTFFVDRQGRLAARILGESAPEVFERILQGLL